jgi:hypothetical protein
VTAARCFVGTREARSSDRPSTSSSLSNPCFFGNKISLRLLIGLSLAGFLIQIHSKFYLNATCSTRNFRVLSYRAHKAELLILRLRLHNSPPTLDGNFLTRLYRIAHKNVLILTPGKHFLCRSALAHSDNHHRRRIFGVNCQFPFSFSKIFSPQHAVSGYSKTIPTGSGVGRQMAG